MPDVVIVDWPALATFVPVADAEKLDELLIGMDKSDLNVDCMGMTGKAALFLLLFRTLVVIEPFAFEPLCWAFVLLLVYALSAVNLVGFKIKNFFFSLVNRLILGFFTRTFSIQAKREKQSRKIK